MYYIALLKWIIITKICEIVRPDYFVHGTDWRRGPQSLVRKKLIKTMCVWDGKIVEFSYTNNISSSKLRKKI